MRLTRIEKVVLLAGLKALSSEASYWGDKPDNEEVRAKLEKKFEKELKS